MEIPTLSLFSGVGGFELGLELAGVPCKTVLYGEINEFAKSVIRERIRDGAGMHDAPIVDVRDIARSGRAFRGKIGLLHGGFPCTSFSSNGLREQGDSSLNLWPLTLDCISGVEPDYVLLENVRGLAVGSSGRAPYAATIVGQLSDHGYSCRWTVIPAPYANHRRQRFLLLAHRNDR